MITVLALAALAGAAAGAVTALLTLGAVYAVASWAGKRYLREQARERA